MDSFTSIDAKELSKLQQQKSTITIDVRDELETPLLDHTLYLKAPMSKFDDFLKREITEEHVIFICAHGIRSVTAAEAFNEKYGTSKKAYSLKGGIARWANELDLQT
ncbi:thiosulfate sulfurtransferase [compost metagenome]